MIDVLLFLCDRLQPIKPKSAVTAAGSSSQPAAPRAPRAPQQQQQQAADMIDIDINDDVTESRPSTALSDFSAVTELNDSNQTGRYYISTIQLGAIIPKRLIKILKPNKIYL